jgi:hypothetical protein
MKRMVPKYMTEFFPDRNAPSVQHIAAVTGKQATRLQSNSEAYLAGPTMYNCGDLHQTLI